MGHMGSFPRVKRPGRETDHSPPSSADVKDWVELYVYCPSTTSWRGAQFKKHRDNFTFSFTTNMSSRRGAYLGPRATLLFMQHVSRDYVCFWSSTCVPADWKAIHSV